MKPEVKALWLEALRSGKYIQGIETLRKEILPSRILEHCCLGVLCDLHSKETGGVWEEGWKGKYTYYGKDTFPPQCVIEWAGLQNQVFDTGDVRVFQHKSLSNLNDEGKSFAEIADIIEEGVY